jgi:arsenate reductase-like glutaredoxin family protein
MDVIIYHNPKCGTSRNAGDGERVANSRRQTTA